MKAGDSMAKRTAKTPPIEWPPWPVVLLVLAFATPPEFSIYLGGLRLSAYRLVLIANFIPCVNSLMTRASGRWQLADSLMLAHGLWAILALLQNGGLEQGLETGGIYLIEAVGGYLIGRCHIRNSDDFLGLAKTMMMVMCVTMAMACVESLTGNHFVREISRRFLGGPPIPFVEPRMGFHRAFASFDHPILYGIFCASAFGLAVYVLSGRIGGLRGTMLPGLVAIATFFSLSAGAFAAVAVQVFTIGWDRMTQGVNRRWSILGGVFIACWTVICVVASRSPVKVFLTYMTFSPGTGYFRLNIWEYGSAEVQRHPWVGIGLREWQRPEWMHSSSIDNFWLATAVRYGVPAFLFLAGAVVVLVANAAKARSGDRDFRDCRAAWITSMAGLCMAACTVHYWNALFCLFCFLLGAGAWLSDPAPRAQPARALARKPRVGGRMVTQAVVARRVLRAT
jgi:hypothetical protein